MPVRAAKLLLPIALLLAFGSPALAGNAAADVQGAIGKAQEAAGRDDCLGVLDALDPVLPTLEKGPERLLAQRMRLICLGAEGRAGELAAVQRELAEAMPRDGMVKAFGVLIAADENRFGDAADQIAVIAATSPQSLNVLTGAAVRAISMKLAEDHAHDAVRRRMMIALARADWEPTDIPELRVGFAEGAIEALIDQGEPAEAEGLLERIDQPEVLSGMMIDRHFMPLWPALEARLGPASTISVDRFARDRLSLFGDLPDSEVALRDAANAMLLLGRYQDVVDMTRDVAVGEDMSRDRVRILLYRARALAAMHRNDEVDRLFAPLRSVDLRRTPSASTALITYAEFLDEIGRPEEALAVARDTRSRGEDMLSDLGKLWLDRTEICTLSTLGRMAEADSAIRAIKAKAGQNQPAAIEALLCAKRVGEASEIAVKAFQDDQIGGELLIQFQPAASLFAPAPSRLRDLWLAFLTRPEIKAAFDRKGRVLPRSLWPDARPRAIPRRPSSGTTLT